MPGQKLLGVGECMLELRDEGDGRMQLAFGGDVLNTLVYAQRAGIMSQFSTSTGDDHYSSWLKSQWINEGINCDLVQQKEDEGPPLYIIRNDELGERSFQYWRTASPFQKLLESENYVSRLAAAMRQAKCIYFSGITLAMLEADARGKLLEMISLARDSQQVAVAFDPNYRPRLWDSRGRALECFQRAYQVTDWVFPSLADDFELLGEVRSADELAADLMCSGSTEVVIKNGEHGATVFADDEVFRVPSVAAERVVDTTGAGDSFNGAYLAARLAGSSAIASAQEATRVASRVVQFPGAITPSLN